MKESAVFTTVTLSTNEKIPLVAPNMGDILPSIILGSSQSWLEVTITATTGKTWDWYKGLSIEDGTKLIKAIMPVMKSVTELVAQLAAINSPTKH